MKTKLLNIAFLTIVILAFASCVTQRRCNAKFPPVVETIRHDSIITRDTIIYRDRVFPYAIPGDTVFAEKKVPIATDISPIWLQNDYATATAWVENSKLKLQLTQKDQVIKIIIDSAYKETKFWKEKYTNEKQTITLPPEKYIPKIYKNALSICIVIFAAAFLFFGWKAYGFFKK